MSKLKVVCLGDSITFGYNNVKGVVTQAPLNYPKHLENLLKTKYDDVEVINSGMSGWQVKQANQHLDELVINHKPDICFIMYGINDKRGSVRGGLPVSTKYYFSKLNEVILKLQLAGIKVVLMNPICIENEKVTSLAQDIIDFARFKNIDVIDINSRTRKLIEESGQPIEEVIGDGVHFVDEWYYVIGDIVFEDFLK